jgi:hypothetical protein
MPGLAPFDSPERVVNEAKRMRTLDDETRHRMLREMERRILALPKVMQWNNAKKQIEIELGERDFLKSV